MEAIATLEYQKLEKHCSGSNKLSHEVDTCQANYGSRTSHAINRDTRREISISHLDYHQNNSRAPDFSQRADRYGRLFGARPSDKVIERSRELGPGYKDKEITPSDSHSYQRDRTNSYRQQSPQHKEQHNDLREQL